VNGGREVEGISMKGGLGGGGERGGEEQGQDQERVPGFWGQSGGSSRTGPAGPTGIDYTLIANFWWVSRVTYAGGGWGVGFGKRVSGGVMDLQTVLPLAVLIIGCAAYVFWPQDRVVAPVEKTRLDYLRERKSVVYDNLRDLNFEFRAGKFPEEDYARQRGDLEAEAAKVVTEMETLGG